MEQGDVRVSLAVMYKGSFGEVTRSLGMSRPTVGRRIKALETEAQQTLFRRTKEELVLTDVGDRVLKLTETAENSALAVKRRLAGNHERLEGILRIFYVEWFTDYALVPVPNELTRRHLATVPEIIVNYRLLDPSYHDADIAFRIVPFTEPDIVQRRLITIPYALYGTPDMAGIVRRNPVAVGLILMNMAQSHFSDVAWLLDRSPRLRRVFTSTSRAVQAQICQRRVGIAALPRPPDDVTAGLQPTSISEPPPSKNTWVGYHSGLRHMDRLRVMLDITDMLLTDPGAAAT